MLWNHISEIVFILNFHPFNCDSLETPTLIWIQCLYNNLNKILNIIWFYIKYLNSKYRDLSLPLNFWLTKKIKDTLTVEQAPGYLYHWRKESMHNLYTQSIMPLCRRTLPQVSSSWISISLEKDTKQPSIANMSIKNKERVCQLGSRLMTTATTANIIKSWTKHAAREHI